MANKTYLDIINIALRDINEVPMTASEFLNPRGIQATTKEMVNRAYADILNHSKEWPFLVSTTGSETSVATVDGTQEYSFDTNVDNVDWDSFFIVNNDSTRGHALQTIDEDFYTRHLKERDATTGFKDIPIFVYRTKNFEGFGLSPIPNEVFTVTFSAWNDPTLLVNSVDEIAIPERYYNVLIARVRYYLWLFRENPQQANFALDEFNKGIKKMHSDLVQKQSIDMRAV